MTEVPKVHQHLLVKIHQKKQPNYLVRASEKKLPKKKMIIGMFPNITNSNARWMRIRKQVCLPSNACTLSQFHKIKCEAVNVQHSQTNNPFHQKHQMSMFK